MDSRYSLNGDLETKATPNVKPIQNKEKVMKNISPYMSKDLIAAAGFNVNAPIVNAIIGNLTGALPTKKSETDIIKCEICDCELSSNIVLSFHINGSRHKKRLKALEIIEQLKNTKDVRVLLGSSNYPNAFRCQICSLTVNSPQQLEIHLYGTDTDAENKYEMPGVNLNYFILVAGAKHKKKAAKIALSESDSSNLNKCSECNDSSDNSGSPPPKKRKREEQKVISCDICNIFLNSQTQYDQHLLSKKHLNKVNVSQSN